ncbi:MAG TPA: CAP domain-containing protein [Acidobacteriaceae bacterium]|nr:CAP domain-containing protein [Acidobacteriaceae bacterium]
MHAQSAAEYKAAGVLFQSANRERVARGLQSLQIDSALNTAARLHAQRMAAAGEISHLFPGELDLAARVRQQGLKMSTVAENVAAASSAEQIHDAWMHSPLHRANLLDIRVNVIGIGVVERDGRLFAVEDFAHALPSLTLRQQEQQVAAVLRNLGIKIQADSTIARSYCGETPQRVHPLPRLIMNYTTPDLHRLPQQVEDRIASGHTRSAGVGACSADTSGGLTAYHMIVLLY